MIDRLYVARGDQTFGPFSARQLRGLAAAGRLRRTDSVWRDGAMENSVFAAKVKNLFPSPQTQNEVAGALEVSEPAPLPAVDASSPPSRGPLVPTELTPAPSDAPERPGDPGPEAVRTDSAPLDSLALLFCPTDQTAQGGTAPKEKAPRPPPAPARKRRAIALKGATLLSQDGVTVQYRKKCTQCGFEDLCRSSMPIGNGMTSAHFYCPKCRKGRAVQIQGIMQ